MWRRFDMELVRGAWCVARSASSCIRLTKQPRTTDYGLRTTLPLLLNVILFLLPASALAHGGGVPRLQNEASGPYRLSAWTQPEPWIINQTLHVSVVIVSGDTSAASVTPITDAAVTAYFHPPDNETGRIVQKAELSQDLGGIFYEIEMELPVTGVWTVELAIEGAQGPATAQFAIEVLSGRSINWWIVGGGGLAVIVLVGLALLLMRR